ncbi:MAG: hypothetical protein ACI9UK_000006 [Candidatus Krumholzibacteriia bacterium]|jgi:hypothetical protein
MALMTNLVRIPTLIRFWAPLQATWLMMAVEGPFFAAVIARLADPKLNLAAHGVAYALAILVEAPVIMMMSAATALVDSRENYCRLRNFMWLMNLGITLGMLVLLFSPLWDLLIHRLMGLDERVARLSWTSLVILLPWPAAIGYRRFYQGVLIRAGLTRRVAWGTAIRLVSMTATTLWCWQKTELPGAWVGATALSVAVLVEALASRIMARGAVNDLRSLEADEGTPLGYRAIWDFYLPLAMTSTISLSVQPLITFFMGMSRSSLESLAVLPVVNSLVFIFRTPGLSLQETAITMLGRSWQNFPVVRRFATMLGGFATLGLVMIGFTPLADIWLRGISGLTPELVEFALTPIRIMCLMPALSVLLSMQRSLCVVTRKTQPITWASAIEISVIAAALFGAIYFGNWVGATAAATALMMGRFASNIYLIGRSG